MSPTRYTKVQTTGEEETHLYNDLPIFAIYKEENGEQTVHVMNAEDIEKTLLPATGKQALYIILAERELVHEENLHDKCRSTALYVGQLNTGLSTNDQVILIQRSTVDGLINAGIPEALCNCVLSLALHSLVAEHAGQRRRYDTLRQEFSWPHMADNLYATIGKCMFCARD